MPHGLVVRARMILACAEGLSNAAVAAKVGASPQAVGKWRRRFLERGVEGLHDELRPGRPRTYDDEKVAAVISRALQERPDEATQWSVRLMSAAEGVSKSTVQRWFSLFGVKPHLQETFKLSTHGSVLHREGARYRGVVPESAGACAGAVRGREVADPGAGAQPADPADGTWLRRRVYPRLRAARHESFFATLECELLDGRSFRSHAEARMAIFEFVEGCYNRRGAIQHWATGRRPPSRTTRGRRQHEHSGIGDPRRPTPSVGADPRPGR